MAKKKTKGSQPYNGPGGVAGLPPVNSSDKSGTFGYKPDGTPNIPAGYRVEVIDGVRYYMRDNDPGAKPGLTPSNRLSGAIVPIEDLEKKWAMENQSPVVQDSIYKAIVDSVPKPGYIPQQAPPIINTAPVVAPPPVYTPGMVIPADSSGMDLINRMSPQQQQILMKSDPKTYLWWSTEQLRRLRGR